MRRNAEAYLCDILQACQRISMYTQGLDRESFHDALMIQDGVILRLEVIGEALNQMRRHFPGEAAAFSSIQPMIDLRNYLVHQYHAISSDVVWAIVENDIPDLAKVAQEQLGETGCL